MDGAINQTFRRYEKKYLLTAEQLGALRKGLEPRMEADRFHETTVCSVYFDTDRYDLVRASLEQPVYKEKLRVRSYGVPEGPGSPCFVEIKKKLRGEVFKRRAEMTVAEAAGYLAGVSRPDGGQDLGELDWFLRRYGHPGPKLFLACEREALVGRDMPDLRVTFDRNIRWRADRLDLLAGDDGEAVLPPGKFLMEVKIPGAAPFWLARLMSELELRPASYSKYGTVYRENLVRPVFANPATSKNIRPMPENGVLHYV